MWVAAHGVKLTLRLAPAQTDEVGHISANNPKTARSYNQDGEFLQAAIKKRCAYTVR